MHNIEIYTDGSSLIKKNNYESSSGCTIYIDNEKAYLCSCYHKNGTNSLGEIYAVLIALTKLDEIMRSNPELFGSKISVYCDSDYVVKSLTTYIKSWARAGLKETWMSYKSSKPVMYQKYFKFIYAKFLRKGNPYNIHFYHINSHLNTPKEISSGRFSFMKRNDMDIDYNEFVKHVNRNNEVDRLADDARINKEFFYESGSNWYQGKSMLTRDNCVVIRSRGGREK